MQINKPSMFWSSTHHIIQNSSYTPNLSTKNEKHDLNIHLYAYDTKHYIPYDPIKGEPALSHLETYINEIKEWMESNFLKVNDVKTEFMLSGAPRDNLKVTGCTLTVGDAEILLSTSAYNIGV